MEENNDLKIEIEKIQIKTIIFGIIFVIFACVIAMRMTYGSFSKLEFSNYDSKVPNSVSYTQNLQIIPAINGINAIKELDDEYKAMTQKYVKEMRDYIKSRYGIEVIIPEINYYTTDSIHYSFTEKNYNKNDNSINIVYSESHLNSKSRTLESVMVHELFHALSHKNGESLTWIHNPNYISKLAEGMTEILTYEFCEYMGYNYNFNATSTDYKFCIEIINFFEIENSHEDFVKWYFNHDLKVLKNIDKRISMNANTKFFSSINRIESCLTQICIGDSKDEEKTEEAFYAIVELLSFYVCSCEDVYKAEYEKLFDEVYQYYIYYVKEINEDIEKYRIEFTEILVK